MISFFFGSQNLQNYFFNRKSCSCVYFFHFLIQRSNNFSGVAIQNFRGKLHKAKLQFCLYKCNCTVEFFCIINVVRGEGKGLTLINKICGTLYVYRV